MAKVALQAASWYNEDLKLLTDAMLETSARLRQTLLGGSSVDTLSPHADDGNTSFVTIPLNKGYSVIVDPEDADLAQWRWHVRSSGLHVFYAARQQNINGKPSLSIMHRVILARKLGRPIQVGMQVDHINGDSLDNRRANLREATPSQNAANRRHRNVSHTSRYKGVSFNHRGKWQAEINLDGKDYYLGLFDTEELAAQAYDRAALELYGEYAGTNSDSMQLSFQSAIRRVGQRSSTNKSGYRGVYSRSGKWIAQFGFNNKHIFLGVFDDKIEAARAYDRAAIAYRGEQACTNFPHEDYGLEVEE